MITIPRTTEDNSMLVTGEPPASSVARRPRSMEELDAEAGPPTGPMAKREAASEPIPYDDLNEEQKKKIKNSVFYSIHSGADPRDIYNYINELDKAIGKPTDILPDTPSRIEDITRATAKGILQVSSSMSQIRSILTGIKRALGAWAPAETPEEREAMKQLSKRLDIKSQVTWELANSPQFAMTNHDIFAKATDIAFSNLPNMAASGAAYALTGGAGAVLTTLVFEGNQAKQTYYDNGGTDQTKANAIFFGVGIINGLLELGGFEGVEEVFKLAARKYAAKVTAARVVSVIAGSMIAEALQEASQELPHLMAESTYRDIDWNEAVTRVIGSALGGAFLGGLTKAGGVAARHTLTTLGRPLPEVELPQMENVLPENKDKVLEQQQEKELEEKVNKVSSETSQEARTPVEPIESTSKNVVPSPPPTGKQGQEPSQLAERTEAAAIEKGITESFGTLAGYEPMNMVEQTAQAQALMNQDFERARRIAMGKEEAPAGLRVGFIYKGVEYRLIQRGDAEGLRMLATQSTVPSLLSAYGQEIVAVRGDGDSNVTGAIRDVVKVREAETAKRQGIKDINKTKKEGVESIKSEIKKSSPKKQDWHDFLRSIQC